MRHFLSINDISKDEILEIFRITDEIKSGKEDGLLLGKKLALFFQKASTRTHVSFESAMLELGGNSVYLDAHTMQVSRGETYEDTARTLSLYVDFLAARLFRQEDLVALSRAASIPVINALTELEHPCQALSDIYTMREMLKEEELASMKVAFMGDIDTNTAHSLMLAATKLGIEVAMVGPKSVNINGNYLRMAQKQGKVKVFDDIKKGLHGSDFVYTDTWVSMGQEEDAERRMRLFEPYQLNKKALAHAKKGAFVMHCLPAHRGEEITAEVLDGKQSIVWTQAKNKMYVEAAILVFLELKNRR